MVITIHPDAHTPIANLALKFLQEGATVSINGQESVEFVRIWGDPLSPMYYLTYYTLDESGGRQSRRHINTLDIETLEYL